MKQNETELYRLEEDRERETTSLEGIRNPRKCVSFLKHSIGGSRKRFEKKDALIVKTRIPIARGLFAALLPLVGSTE